MIQFMLRKFLNKPRPIGQLIFWTVILSYMAGVVSVSAAGALGWYLRGVANQSSTK